MRKWLYTALVFIMSVSAVSAQKIYHAALAGSVILNEVEDRYGAVVYNLSMPEPDAGEEQKKLQEIKKRVGELYPYRISHAEYRKTAGTPLPLVVVNYISDSLSGIPPDNDMAFGENDTTVSVMNSYIAMQKSSTGKIIGFHKSLGFFSSVVGLNGTPNFRYDPKIIYDPGANRYINIMLNGIDSDSYIVVGFSATSSPAGMWHFYKFKGNYGNDTTWFDFPSISITKDEFFFTGNKIFYDSSWQGGFKRSVIYQVRKSDGYNGDTSLTYKLWDDIAYDGKKIRNLYPVKGGGSIKGPQQYFLSNRNFDIRNDTVFLIKLSDTIGDNNATITVTPLKSNIRYGVPPNGRQKDTTVVLATNDGRILGAYEEGHEIQYVSTTMDTISGASAIYHGKILNYKTLPTLQASIIAVDSLDLGYPNLSYTGTSGGTNQSIISFDYTGQHTYAGLAAVFYDGSDYSDIVTIKTGLNSINIAGVGYVQRWGDYSGSQPDWNDAGSVWVNGIYGRSTASYGCYLAKLKAPVYVNPTPVVLAPGILYPNPAEQFIRFEFEIDKEQDISFVIYDIMGRLIDKILNAHCYDGRNAIQFNTASLESGRYFLKIFGADELIANHSFIKR